MVNFVEQEDGTTVEVNQRKVELGEEVKRDGSRVYRVVSSKRHVHASAPKLTGVDHTRVHGSGVRWV
jgi:hypothetical protein